MLAEQREAELDHDGEVRHRGRPHGESGIEASIRLERRCWSLAGCSITPSCRRRRDPDSAGARLGAARGRTARRRSARSSCARRAPRARARTPRPTTARRRSRASPTVVHDVEQLRHALEALEHRARSDASSVHLQRAAFVEPHHDVVDVHAAGALLERRVGRAANQLARDRVPPTSSPSYSSSILPVIAGSAA